MWLHSDWNVDNCQQHGDNKVDQLSTTLNPAVNNGDYTITVQSLSLYLAGDWGSNTLPPKSRFKYKSGSGVNSLFHKQVQWCTYEYCTSEFDFRPYCFSSEELLLSPKINTFGFSQGPQKCAVNAALRSIHSNIALRCGIDILNIDYFLLQQSIACWVKMNQTFIATPQCSHAAVIVQWQGQDISSFWRNSSIFTFSSLYKGMGINDFSSC